MLSSVTPRLDCDPFLYDLEYPVHTYAITHFPYCLFFWVCKRVRFGIARDTIGQSEYRRIDTCAFYARTFV